MDVFHTEIYRHHRIRIVRDFDPTAPNDWGDDGLFLIADHRQFSVREPGFDLTEYPGPDYTHHDGRKYHVFPLRAYIHGGVALSLGTSGQFGDHWDSGWVGLVFVNQGDTGGDLEHATKAANGLLEEWNDYLLGNCWGYIVDVLSECPHCGKENTNEIDSCWGFICDYDGYVLDEARRVVDSITKTQEVTG